MKRFMLFGMLLATWMFISAQSAMALGIIDMSASVSPNWDNSWNATTSSGTALYTISIDPASKYGANVFSVTFEDDIFASVGTASLMPASPSDWVLSMDANRHLIATSATDILTRGENPLSFLVDYTLCFAEQYNQASGYNQISGSEWAWKEGGPWEQAVGALNTTDLTDLAFGGTSTLHAPEPATMFLLGSGLIGLGWIGRKKTKNGSKV